MNNLYLEKLLFKIKNAPDFETLFCLEEEFNKVGLTLRCTAKDRMVLCRIIEGGLLIGEASYSSLPIDYTEYRHRCAAIIECYDGPVPLIY